MSRTDVLMRSLAEFFREAGEPFDQIWLRENDVTAAEKTWVADEIANAIDAHVVSTAAVRALSNRLATRFPQPQRMKGLIREQRREP